MPSSAGTLGRGVGRHLAPACCPHSSHSGGWPAWYGGAVSVAPRGDAGVCAWPSPGLCNQARGRGGGVAAWASCGCGLAGRLVDGRLEAEGPVGKEGRVVCMRLGLRAEAPESKGQCGEPVPFADGELSWARVPTSPTAKRPQILWLAQPSSTGTYRPSCACLQSSAAPAPRKHPLSSGTSVGWLQPCSCPGSRLPPARARRVWRTHLEATLSPPDTPTSAPGCS